LALVRRELLLYTRIGREREKKGDREEERERRDRKGGRERERWQKEG
jgi:hypothetical protein